VVGEQFRIPRGLEMRKMAFAPRPDQIVISVEERALGRLPGRMGINLQRACGEPVAGAKDAQPCSFRIDQFGKFAWMLNSLEGSPSLASYDNDPASIAPKRLERVEQILATLAAINHADHFRQLCLWRWKKAHPSRRLSPGDPERISMRRLTHQLGEPISGAKSKSTQTPRDCLHVMDRLQAKRIEMHANRQKPASQCRCLSFRGTISVRSFS